MPFQTYPRDDPRAGRAVDCQNVLQELLSERFRLAQGKEVQYQKALSHAVFARRKAAAAADPPVAKRLKQRL